MNRSGPASATRTLGCRRRTCVRIAAWLALAASALAVGQALASSPAERADRRRALEVEIDRLEGELGELGTRERGVLDELERLETEIRLRRSQLEHAELELVDVTSAIEEITTRLEELEREQTDRMRYLAFRLREIYKQGPHQGLRRAIERQRVESYLAAQRYAAELSARDGRVLAAYRETASRLEEKGASLSARSRELSRVREEVQQRTRTLAAQRGARETLLGEIRNDRTKREAALGELESAATALDRLAGSLATEGAAPPRLDVQKFRGLLDWPADGEVSEGFGAVTHPRFRTKVPHPGLDIDASEGEPIRSVFDGVVVFASWMRGYGLTAIIDHGGGILSIYAHASALLVEPGEEILRGRMLGTVGDSGSLRGPYLYFELREDGAPVDPGRWLRPR